MSAPQDPQGGVDRVDPQDDTTTPRPADTNAPRPFAFGEAPEPAEWPEPVKKPRVTGLATHTGTDPYGRAIGPAEDHTEPKRDADGLTVPEAAERHEEAKKKPARRDRRRTA